MTEQEQIRQAMAKLTGILAGIARTADEKNRDRCPYKTVALRCTFRSGCQNQRRDSTGMMCGGDEFVRWSPMGQRLKPLPLKDDTAARLKPCPDTHDL
jgi:ribosome modulation factor